MPLAPSAGKWAWIARPFGLHLICGSMRERWPRQQQGEAAWWDEMGAAVHRAHPTPPRMLHVRQGKIAHQEGWPPAATPAYGGGHADARPQPMAQHPARPAHVLRIPAGFRVRSPGATRPHTAAVRSLRPRAGATAAAPHDSSLQQAQHQQGIHPRAGRGMAGRGVGSAYCRCRAPAAAPSIGSVPLGRCTTHVRFQLVSN
jgi:hypothetical protein